MSARLFLALCDRVDHRVALPVLLVFGAGCIRHPNSARVEPGRVPDVAEAKFIENIDVGKVRDLDITYIDPTGKQRTEVYVSSPGEIARILDAIASASHVKGKPPPTSPTPHVDWIIEIEGGGGGEDLGLGGLRDELPDRWGPGVTAAIEAHDPWPLPLSARQR